jgi:hypothetical protein
MEHMNISQFNLWAKEHIIDESKFDDEGFIIMENNHNYKTTGIIANIFEDNWEEYYSQYKDTLDQVRPNASKEVKKIIDCSNHNLGASVYVCKEDGEIYFCHHTCKGKLCSSCGIKTQKLVTENILQKCITTKHRHMTFTIPKELTSWFFYKLTTLNILFDAVNDTLYSIVNGKVKKKRKYDLKYSPGFFAFLHTFGRPLNFNPHIHVVIAETIFDKNKKFKKCNYFNYDALSKRFMKILLDKMEKHFGKTLFRTTKNEMYLKYKNGFYVNNRMEDDGYKFDSIKELIKYVTRYCARPVIAESRILKYENNNVTYCFRDHTEEKYHEVTVSAFDFITKLLRHLLPSNFKSIRYFGFYNKISKICDDISRIISKEKQQIRKSFLKWHNSILTSFKHIPIKCPKCGHLMERCFEVS